MRRTTSSHRRTTRRRHRTVFSQGSFWFWTLMILGIIWVWYGVAGGGTR